MWYEKSSENEIATKAVRQHLPLRWSLACSTLCWSAYLNTTTVTHGIIYKWVSKLARACWKMPKLDKDWTKTKAKSFLRLRCYEVVSGAGRHSEADCFSFFPFVATRFTSCCVTAVAVLSNVSMCSSETATVKGKPFLLSSAAFSAVSGVMFRCQRPANTKGADADLKYRIPNFKKRSWR